MRHYTNPMDSLSQCRVSLQDAYQEIVDCKAKLADAEAERSEARSLLLNGIQTNGDSLAFLEHVRREHAAVVAERDAAESLAWDALGRPDGTHDTSNVQRLCEAHGALKAKLDQTRDWYADRWARLRAFLAKGSAMEKGACDIMANGHLLADQDRKSAVALATERAEAAEAKLAALVEAMERIKDIMGGHDGCQGFSSTEDVWGIADKALAAAKVQP